MTTLQLRSEINIELSDFVRGVSQLETSEIEQLLSKISVILAHRKASSLQDRESELLQKIGEGLPNGVQERYGQLQKKLLSEEITSDEHEELLGLLEIVEDGDAKRLQSLIELSQLRNIGLDELMGQLGIGHSISTIYA